MKKHFTGHILQTWRSSLENIDYSVSFALSKKVHFYMKIKNTKQITDLSRLELLILKMTSNLPRDRISWSKLKFQQRKQGIYIYIYIYIYTVQRDTQ